MTPISFPFLFGVRGRRRVLEEGRTLSSPEKWLGAIVVSVKQVAKRLVLPSYHTVISECSIGSYSRQVRVLYAVA